MNVDIDSLQPLEHDSVWEGEQLAERNDWLVELSDDDRSNIMAAVEASHASQQSIESLEAADFPLGDFATRLTAIQRSLEHGAGGVLLRGLPVEQCDEATARRMFWGLSQFVGTPVSQSAKGQRIFSVRDAGLPTDDPRNRGPMTRKGLTFHSDRCDVIAFLCLQQAAEGGENEVVSSPALFNALLAERPDLLGVLLQPFLFQRHNVDLGNDLATYEQPIFSFCEGQFAGFLMQVLIERAYARPETPSMSAVQREALDYLQQRAGEMAFCFRQQPGDLVLLNNLVTLHRRRAFVDHEEEAQKRHILRIWLAIPGSRPLDRAFAPTFGDTRAGAIRGGMRET